MEISKLDKNMVVKVSEEALTWYDASGLTLEGKGWSDTPSIYTRLPSKAEGTVRGPVWDLGLRSAGISVHFTTDSPSLSVRWDGCSSMDHMPATGVSGLDLYVRHEGKWRWLAVARPTKDENESLLFEGLPVGVREFMLYLPLYNQIRHVHLGVPHAHEVAPSAPRPQKPIVFYGTSITQGGCASRPGMCYTAILGRWLNHPTVNLGFSGNGKMEPEVIDLLCELDATVFVLDTLPNMNAEAVNEREENAIRRLRSAHHNTPIVLVENIIYCDAFLKHGSRARCDGSNEAQAAIYQKLVDEGMTGLHYVGADNLIGHDGEATVDGVHMTDLGYMRFAEELIGTLETLV